MFQDLRKGSTIYILERGENGLSLKTGQVVNDPQPKYGQMQMSPNNFNSMQELYVDVAARCGDENFDFQRLNAKLNVANSGGYTVSDNKDVIAAEVEKLMEESDYHLSRVQYYEKVKESGDGIMRQLNPKFAKEKEQEEKIGMLEERMGDIGNKLEKVLNLLSETVERGKPNKNKKED